MAETSLSDPFHVPTHMWPLIMKHTPPNILRSETPVHRETSGRIRWVSNSSFVTSTLLMQ